MASSPVGRPRESCLAWRRAGTGRRLRLWSHRWASLRWRGRSLRGERWQVSRGPGQLCGGRGRRPCGSSSIGGSTWDLVSSLGRAQGADVRMTPVGSSPPSPSCPRRRPKATRRVIVPTATRRLCPGTACQVRTWTRSAASHTPHREVRDARPATPEAATTPNSAARPGERRAKTGEGERLPVRSGPWNGERLPSPAERHRRLAATSPSTAGAPGAG